MSLVLRTFKALYQIFCKTFRTDAAPNGAVFIRTICYTDVAPKGANS